MKLQFRKKMWIFNMAPLVFLIILLIFIVSLTLSDVVKQVQNSLYIFVANEQVEIIQNQLGVYSFKTQADVQQNQIFWKIQYYLNQKLLLNKIMLSQDFIQYPVFNIFDEQSFSTVYDNSNTNYVMWMNLNTKTFNELSDDTRDFIMQLRFSFISSHIQNQQIKTNFYWKIFIANSDGTVIFQVLDKQKFFKGNLQKLLQNFQGFDIDSNCSYLSQYTNEQQIQNDREYKQLDVDPRCWQVYSFCNSFKVFSSNIYLNKIGQNKTEFGICQTQTYSLIQPSERYYNVTILESFSLYKEVTRKNSSYGQLTYFSFQNDQIPYSLRNDDDDDGEQGYNSLVTLYDIYDILNQNSINSLKALLYKIQQIAESNTTTPQRYTTIYDPSDSGQSILIELKNEVRKQLLSYSLDSIFRVLVFSPIYNDQYFKYIPTNKSVHQLNPLLFVGLNFDAEFFNSYTSQSNQSLQKIQIISICVTISLFVIALLVAHFKLKKSINLFIDSIDWTIELMNIISNESIFDSNVNEDFINDFFKRYCLNQEAKELLQTYFILTLNLVKTANNYFQEGQEEAALEKYNEAYYLFTKLGNQSGIGICLNNIGNIYFKKGNYIEAISLQEKQYITAQMANHPKQKEKLDQVKLIIAVRALQIAQTINHVDTIPSENLPSFQTQIQVNQNQDISFLKPVQCQQTQASCQYNNTIVQTKQSNQKILITSPINSQDSPLNRGKTQGKKSIFQTKHKKIEFDFIVEEEKNQCVNTVTNYEIQLRDLHLNLRQKQISQDFIQENIAKSRSQSEMFIRQKNNLKQKLNESKNINSIQNSSIQNDKSQSKILLKENEKKYDVAIQYFSVAYEYFSQMQTKRSISQVTYICISMAECYLKQKKYSQSQGLINEARKKLQNCNQINIQKQHILVNQVDSILSNQIGNSKNSKLNVNQNYKNSNQNQQNNYNLNQSIQSSQSKKEKQTNIFRETFFELQSPILFKAALQNKNFLRQNFQNFTVSIKNDISRKANRNLSSIEDLKDNKNLRRNKRISSAKLSLQKNFQQNQLSPNSCKSYSIRCPSIVCVQNLQGDSSDTKKEKNKQQQIKQNAKIINTLEANQVTFKSMSNNFSKSQYSPRKGDNTEKNFNNEQQQKQKQKNQKCTSTIDQELGEKIEQRKRTVSIDQKVKSSLFQKIHNGINYLNKADENIQNQKNSKQNENQEDNSKKLQAFSFNGNQLNQNENLFSECKVYNSDQMHNDLNLESFQCQEQIKQGRENSGLLSPIMSFQNTARPFLNNQGETATAIQKKLSVSKDKLNHNQPGTSYFVTKQEEQDEQKKTSPGKHKSSLKKRNFFNFISQKLNIFTSQNNKNTVQQDMPPEFQMKLQNQLNTEQKDDLFLPYSVLYMKICLIQGKFFKSQGERYFIKAVSQFTEVLDYFDPNNQEDQYDPLDKLEAMKELLLIFQQYNCKEQIITISEEINKMENSQVMKEKLSRPLFFIDSFI